MKTNIWNIKEILQIPSGSGGSRGSGKVGATSDYLSLTDSQFLLGSQFWPENSQAFSQEVPFSSRNPKQNSEEGNDFRVSTNYNAKPYLFGGDTETHSATNRKPAIGVLDRFEEDKKRAKEKSESEIINHEFLQLNDSLEKVKPLLEHINYSGETTHKVLVEGVNVLTKTIKESMASVCDGIMPKIEEVIMKLNSQSQTLREMEDREAKLATATKDLSSHLQDLQQNMDSLKVEHGQEKSVLAEMQSLLIATMEAQTQRSVSRPVQMVNSEVQTSPGWVERLCVVSEEKRVFQGVRLSGPTATCLLNGPSEPTVGLCCSTKQTNTAYDQTVPSRAALRPLPTNQERQVVQKTADGANESLLPQSFCTQALEPDGDGDTVSGSALQEGIVRYPLRNQVSRSSCILGSIQDESQMMAITARPQDRVMPARQEVMAPNFSVQRGLQKIRPKKRPRGKTRALIPQNAPSVYRGVGQGKVFRKLRPDRGEGEEENEELSPLYQVKNKAHCENVKPPKQLKENKPVGLRNDERRHMWSHNTNSTQFMSASDGVDQKTKGKTYAKAKIPKKAQGGLWNLFDFVDSD